MEGSFTFAERTLKASEGFHWYFDDIETTEYCRGVIAVAEDHPILPALKVAHDCANSIYGSGDTHGDTPTHGKEYVFEPLFLKYVIVRAWHARQNPAYWDSFIKDEEQKRALIECCAEHLRPPYTESK